MKKVVIFGAAGHTGKYITKKMKAEKDIELSVFVRNPAKFEGMDMTGVNIMQGDALNADDVKRAMEGQEVLLCSLEYLTFVNHHHFDSARKYFCVHWREMFSLWHGIL